MIGRAERAGRGASRGAFLALLVFGAAAAGCHGRQELRARVRVKIVFDGLQAAPPDSEQSETQAAILSFMSHTPSVHNGPQLEAAQKEFVEWAAKRDLKRKIDRYRIESVESQGPHECLAVVTVEDRVMKLRVPNDGRMRWEF